ncbi:MAG: glucosaminidase domain-containing protein [Acidimicrobiia bacterium]
MSITSTVERPVRIVAVVLLAAAVMAVSAGAPAGARLAAPDLGSTGPADRIATLAAMVSRRADDVATATARRDGVRSRLVTAQQQEQAAQARTDQLGAIEVQAAARYDASRARVQRFAAAAYRGGPSVTPLTQLLSSDSAADYAYRNEIVRRVGVSQRRMVSDAKRDRAAAAAAAEAARNERNRLHALAASLLRDLPVRENALTTAIAARDRAQFWLARWQAIAAGPDTPILGPARLGADELTAWFNGTHHHANTTVPIDELARYYIEEGASTGVRSDIAFAQSMLETGGFSFPSGGQVLGTDNNFAGMGACDSCSGGNRFPDARTGVRAQLQQLRVYADANLTNAMLNPPAVNPKLDHHHLKGKVTTWAGLTHTWATANTYGDRILAIYESILGWLTDRARI